MKIKNKEFFIGISLIFIISLFCISTVVASSITVTSKPSAKSSLTYKDYTMTWENHCPLCGSVETLIFNPKETYEGELTCSICGADYCSVTGKDKYGGGPRAHLTVDDPHDENKNNTNQINNIKKNETSENDLRNLLINDLNFASYSQITATTLENLFY